MTNQKEAMENDRNAIVSVVFWIIIIVLAAAFGLVYAGAVTETMPEKFQVSYWDMTDTYECKGRFPDGNTFNLKSKTDLNYSQWKQKIKTAWEAYQEPPEMPVLYETDDYAIRDPNDGNLVFEWRKDDVKLNVTKTDMPVLAEGLKKMNELFAGMP